MGQFNLMVRFLKIKRAHIFVGLCRNGMTVGVQVNLAEGGRQGGRGDERRRERAGREREGER